MHMGKPWLERFVGAGCWLQSAESIQRDGRREVSWELCKAAFSVPD